jgi:hypothetical protein
MHVGSKEHHLWMQGHHSMGLPFRHLQSHTADATICHRAHSNLRRQHSTFHESPRAPLCARRSHIFQMRLAPARAQRILHLRSHSTITCKCTYCSTWRLRGEGWLLGDARLLVFQANPQRLRLRLLGQKFELLQVGQHGLRLVLQLTPHERFSRRVFRGLRSFLRMLLRLLAPEPLILQHHPACLGASLPERFHGRNLLFLQSVEVSVLPILSMGLSYR